MRNSPPGDSTSRETFRKILGFAATSGIFLFSVWVVDRNTRRLDETNQAVTHTYETINALDAMLATLTDAESAQRGYTITGDPMFLQPYATAAIGAWRDFADVKRLTMDNTAQQMRLDTVRARLVMKFVEMDSVVRVRRVDSVAAIALVRSGRGKVAMDSVRATAARMQAVERRLMQERTARSQSVVQQSMLVTVLAGVLGITMVVLLYRLVRSSERLQAEAAGKIAEQREQLQITLTSIGDGVISTDSHGNVTYLNKVAQTLTGWTNDAAVGNPLVEIFTIVNESTRQPVENPALRALREGRIVGLANHTILIARDGVERPIDDSAAPIRADDGTIIGGVLVFRDISDRYAAERREREAQQELTATLESISDAFMRIDRDWSMRYVNAETERLFRLAAADTIGESFWELFPEMKESSLEQNFRACADSKAPRDFDHYSARWDRWYAIRCYPGRDGGLSVFMRDITDARRAQSLVASLSAESERQRRLFDTALSNTADFIYTFDREGRYSYVNNATERFLALPASEVVGLNSHQLMDDVGLADKLTRQIAEVVQNGITLRDTTPYDGKFATAREYEYIFVPIINAAGAIEGVAGSTRDITERQQIERRLRESQADLDFALASADLGHWSFNLVDGSSQRTSRHDEIFGYDSSLEWTYQTFLAHVDPGERDEIDRAFQHAVATEGIWDIQCTIRRADGVERQIWKTARIKRGSDGRLEKMLGIVGDVTEQRQMEHERSRAELALRDADRRKDEFLATLAHELRNPLAPIRNGLEIIRIASANATVVEQTQKMMDRQMNQMVRLVDDLLDVSRVSSGKLELQRERFDLQLMIDIAIETARPLIDTAGLTLTVLPLPEPIMLDGDVTRLAQVLSNLLSNSARYTPRGGSVALTVAREPGAVLLSVKDNGIGIPPEMLESIFGMFTQVDRRLEKVSGGLGLGLSLVKAIVDGHGGTAEARSDGDGLGSEVLIRLPIDDSSNDATML